MIHFLLSSLQHSNYIDSFHISLFFFGTGCLSVPLFNQKKRSRLPLTSNPSESEMFSGYENRDMLSFTSSVYPSSKSVRR